MAEFIWTIPDPLNSSAKTRAIYIIELQNAINTKRGQVGLGGAIFTNANPRTEYKADHVIELRNNVDILLPYFGYSSVTDASLLGRDWSTLKTGLISAGNHYYWPIALINDIRDVLNKLTLWIETWTPLAIQTFYSLSGSSTQSTYNDFNGDRPNWRSSGRLLVSDTATSPFGNVRSKIIDVSKKLELYQSASLTTNLFNPADPDYSWLRVTNIIRTPSNTINRIIDSSTIFSGNINMTFSYSSSGNQYGWNDCQMVLGTSEGVIIYYTDDSISSEYVSWNSRVGTTAIHLPKSEFTNLSRNLYNDFYSIRGFYPSSSAVVSSFSLEIGQLLPATTGVGGTHLSASSTCVIDNLRIG